MKYLLIATLLFYFNASGQKPIRIVTNKASLLTPNDKHRLDSLYAESFSFTGSSYYTANLRVDKIGFDYSRRDSTGQQITYYPIIILSDSGGIIGYQTIYKEWVITDTAKALKQLLNALPLLYREINDLRADNNILQFNRDILQRDNYIVNKKRFDAMFKEAESKLQH